DKKRGDTTFYIQFGLQGVKRFFMISYLTGLIILSISLMVSYPIPGMLFLFIGLITFFVLNQFIRQLQGVETEYQKVMNIKFIASLSFVLFLLAANAIRYEWIEATYLVNFF
ncbi:MAG: hypothetical protein WD513_00260, partial [Balneolaceae bacterium]